MTTTNTTNTTANTTNTIANSICNATPHPISIISNASFDPDIRKWVVPADEADFVAEIPSKGMLLSVWTESVELCAIGGIPCYGKAVTGMDTLPDDYDIIVVSALYAANYVAAKGNDRRLYTVCDPVYTPDGRTVLGCRGITPYDGMGIGRESYTLFMASYDAEDVAKDILCGHDFKHICDGYAEMEIVSDGLGWHGVEITICQEEHIDCVLQWLDNHGFHGVDTLVVRVTEIGTREARETVGTVIIGETALSAEAAARRSHRKARDKDIAAARRSHRKA